MYLSEPIECAVPRVEPSVNSVLGNNDVTRFVKMQLCSLWCHSGGGCASLGTLSPPHRKPVLYTQTFGEPKCQQSVLRVGGRSGEPRSWRIGIILICFTCV